MSKGVYYGYVVGSEIFTMVVFNRVVGLEKKYKIFYFLVDRSVKICYTLFIVGAYLRFHSKKGDLMLENEGIFDEFFTTAGAESGENNLFTDADYIKRTVLPQSALSMRKGHMQYAHDMSLDEFDALFVMQKGHCAICGTHQKHLRTALCVDHNHATGATRGLLCNDCNLRLGRVENEMLCTWIYAERALDYLEQHS